MNQGFKISDTLRRVISKILNFEVSITVRKGYFWGGNIWGRVGVLGGGFRLLR